MRISDAETVVMEMLWQHGPSSAEAVISHVAEGNDWSAATVRTLLNRLLTKEAIAADRDGRKYIYRALIERSDFLTEASDAFLGRLFDGELSPFLAHFSRRNKLTDADVAQLKAMIAKIEADD